jgi:YegS/Rv2252/BmrU family lipid kinase
MLARCSGLARSVSQLCIGRVQPCDRFARHSMRTFLVVNPQSANGETGRRWPEIQAEVLRVLGGTADHAFTERPMHAAAIAAQALREGYRRIVVIGGDGTINEVVNGFFQVPGGPPADASLSLVPRGTGGDFRRTFDLDGRLKEACLRLRQERLRPLDVGRVRFTAPDGKEAERYFVNVASFGVSGRVDQAVNETTKALGGRVSFILASLKALTAWRDQVVRIRVDDGAEESLEVTTLAVANARYFGGGMKVAPQADPFDGLFDVTVWSGYRLKDFVLKSRSLYDGTHTRLSGTRTFRCKRLEATSDQEVLLDLDGEQPGRLPASFEILPGALQLRV